MNTPLVSSEWLNNNLQNSNLIILDASQCSEPDSKTIPGARIFDLKNAFSSKNSNYPNTFPTREQFEQECRKLGINKNSKIVVFDNRGIYFSPRVWWMFKVMRHENVAVLNGGLTDWISNGFTTEILKTNDYLAGDFSASLDDNSVKDFDFVKDNINTKKHLVVDARSAGRFNGTAPEPRVGLPSGSIPNSINISFETLLDNGKFKNKKELIDVFNASEIRSEPLVFSCGSGVTACIVLLAAELIGKKNEKSVYDGSWTEWALRTEIS